MATEPPSPPESPAGSRTAGDAGIGKPLAIVFLASLVFYVAWFAGVEHWRQRRGPWEVTFSTDAQGDAVIEVAQPRLGIRGVRIVAQGARLPAHLTPATLRFDRPDTRGPLPFGEVRFLDTTFLPGTLTLAVFGHEIEFLPRVLIIDKQEHPWQAGGRYEVPTVR